MDTKLIHNDPFKDYKEIGHITFTFKHNSEDQTYPYSYSVDNNLPNMPADIIINALVETTDRIITFMESTKNKNNETDTQNGLQLPKSPPM